ncbi:hypothetical protein IL306_013898 [Fusarium sp. DS 682]|nr:hypothetical protein IL306_013898 [Fusarium sp. DS 682]
MALKPTLTSLPAEIRAKIFKECLKVDGGYIYNIQTDKLTNADISLRYTCCSIANDTRAIPLAVNTIYFSTIFREDWRSLAGCFNLAATAYYVIEQDLVFHLAEFITPEMYTQLDAKFPRFRPMLESELATHHRLNPVMDRPNLNKYLINRMRPHLCRWVRHFFKMTVYGPSPASNRSFADIHEDDYMDPHGDAVGHSHKRWLKQPGDVRDLTSLSTTGI